MSNHLSRSSFLKRHWRPTFIAGIPNGPIFSRNHQGALPRYSPACSLVSRLNIFYLLRGMELLYPGESVRLSLISQTEEL